jgi:2-iminobutanoate/2-iminopropanoate deaminase
MIMDSVTERVSDRAGITRKRGGRTDRGALHADRAMCEAYDYAKPAAFSRGMSVWLPGATLVFVSGTASVGADGSSLHEGDFRAQARRAYENARAVLNESGADWQDVVKVTVFLKDIAAHYDAFNEARNSYFGEVGVEEFPASTCVEARLCRDELLVEMEMLAVIRH